MRKLLIVAALAALALPGCKKKDEGGDDDTTAQKPDDGEDKPDDGEDEPDDGEDEPDDGDKSAKMRNKMKHCPNAVQGAQTSVERKDDSVHVIIAQSDKDKLTEIKERAEHLAGVAGKPEPNIKHTGQGTGGGDTGHCPVGFKNIELSVKAADDKVTIEIKPMEGMTVDDVYKTVTERLAKMRDGGGHEHGSGMGGGSGGGGGKGEGAKKGKAGKAAKADGHEHGTGSGAGAGGGGKGAASGDQDGEPGK